MKENSAIWKEWKKRLGFETVSAALQVVVDDVANSVTEDQLATDINKATNYFQNFIKSNYTQAVQSDEEVVLPDNVRKAIGSMHEAIAEALSGDATVLSELIHQVENFEIEIPVTPPRRASAAPTPVSFSSEKSRRPSVFADPVGWYNYTPSVAEASGVPVAPIGSAINREKEFAIADINTLNNRSDLSDEQRAVVEYRRNPGAYKTADSKREFVEYAAKVVDSEELNAAQERAINFWLDSENLKNAGFSDQEWGSVWSFATLYEDADGANVSDMEQIFNAAMPLIDSEMQNIDNHGGLISENRLKILGNMLVLVYGNKLLGEVPSRDSVSTQSTDDIDPLLGQFAAPRSPSPNSSKSGGSASERGTPPPVRSASAQEAALAYLGGLYRAENRGDSSIFQQESEAGSFLLLLGAAITSYEDAGERVTSEDVKGLSRAFLEAAKEEIINMYLSDGGTITIDEGELVHAAAQASLLLDPGRTFEQAVKEICQECIDIGQERRAVHAGLDRQHENEDSNDRENSNQGVNGMKEIVTGQWTVLKFENPLLRDTQLSQAAEGLGFSSVELAGALNDHETLLPGEETALAALDGQKVAASAAIVLAEEGMNTPENTRKTGIPLLEAEVVHLTALNAGDAISLQEKAILQRQQGRLEGMPTLDLDVGYYATQYNGIKGEIAEIAAVTPEAITLRSTQIATKNAVIARDKDHETKSREEDTAIASARKGYESAAARVINVDGSPVFAGEEGRTWAALQEQAQQRITAAGTDVKKILVARENVRAVEYARIEAEVARDRAIEPQLKARRDRIGAKGVEGSLLNQAGLPIEVADGYTNQLTAATAEITTQQEQDNARVVLLADLDASAVKDAGFKHRHELHEQSNRAEKSVRQDADAAYHAAAGEAVFDSTGFIAFAKKEGRTWGELEAEAKLPLVGAKAVQEILAIRENIRAVEEAKAAAEEVRDRAIKPQLEAFRGRIGADNIPGSLLGQADLPDQVKGAYAEELKNSAVERRLNTITNAAALRDDARDLRQNQAIKDNGFRVAQGNHVEKGREEEAAMDAADTVYNNAAALEIKNERGEVAFAASTDTPLRTWGDLHAQVERRVGAALGGTDVVEILDAREAQRAVKAAQDAAGEVLNGVVETALQARNTRLEGLLGQVELPAQVISIYQAEKRGVESRVAIFAQDNSEIANDKASRAEDVLNDAGFRAKHADHVRESGEENAEIAGANRQYEAAANSLVLILQDKNGDAVFDDLNDGAPWTWSALEAKVSAQITAAEAGDDVVALLDAREVKRAVEEAKAAAEGVRDRAIEPQLEAFRDRIGGAGKAGSLLDQAGLPVEITVAYTQELTNRAVDHQLGEITTAADSRNTARVGREDEALRDAGFRKQHADHVKESGEENAEIAGANRQYEAAATAIINDEDGKEAFAISADVPPRTWKNLRDSAAAALNEAVANKSVDGILAARKKIRAVEFAELAAGAAQDAQIGALLQKRNDRIGELLGQGSLPDRLEEIYGDERADVARKLENLADIEEGRTFETARYEVERDGDAAFQRQHTDHVRVSGEEDAAISDIKTEFDKADKGDLSNETWDAYVARFETAAKAPNDVPGLLKARAEHRAAQKNMADAEDERDFEVQKRFNARIARISNAVNVPEEIKPLYAAELADTQSSVQSLDVAGIARDAARVNRAETHAIEEGFLAAHNAHVAKKVHEDIVIAGAKSEFDKGNGTETWDAYVARLKVVAETPNDVPSLLNARAEHRAAEDARAEAEGVRDGIIVTQLSARYIRINDGLLKQGGLLPEIAAFYRAEGGDEATNTGLAGQLKQLRGESELRVVSSEERVVAQAQDNEFRAQYAAYEARKIEDGKREQAALDADGGKPAENARQAKLADALTKKATEPEAYRQAQEAVDKAHARINAVLLEVRKEQVSALDALINASAHIEDAKGGGAIRGSYESEIARYEANIAAIEKHAKEVDGRAHGFNNERAAELAGDNVNAGLARSQLKGLEAHLSKADKTSQAAYYLIDAVLRTPLDLADKDTFINGAIADAHGKMGGDPELNDTMQKWRVQLGQQLADKKAMTNTALDIFIGSVPRNVKPEAVDVPAENIALINNAKILQHVFKNNADTRSYTELAGVYQHDSQLLAQKGLTEVRKEATQKAIDTLVADAVSKAPTVAGGTVAAGYERIYPIALALQNKSKSHSETIEALFGENGKGLLTTVPTALKKAEVIDEKSLELYTLLKRLEEIEKEPLQNGRAPFADIDKGISAPAKAAAKNEGKRLFEAREKEGKRQNEWNAAVGKRAEKPNPATGLIGALNEALGDRLQWEASTALRKRLGVNDSTLAAMIVKAGIASGKKVDEVGDAAAMAKNVNQHVLSHPKIYGDMSPANRAVDLTVAALGGEAAIEPKKLGQVKKEALSYYIVASMKQNGSRYYSNTKDAAAISALATALSESSISYADLERIAGNSDDLSVLQEKLIQKAKALGSAINDPRSVASAVDGALQKYKMKTGQTLEPDDSLSAPSKSGVPFNGNVNKIDEDIDKKKKEVAARKEKLAYEEKYAHDGPNKLYRPVGLGVAVLGLILCFVLPPLGAIMVVGGAGLSLYGKNQERKAKARPALLAQEKTSIANEEAEIAKLEAQKGKLKELAKYGAQIGQYSEAVQEELNVKLGVTDTKDAAEKLSAMPEKQRAALLQQMEARDQVMEEIKSGLDAMKKADFAKYTGFIKEAGSEKNAIQEIAKDSELQNIVNTFQKSNITSASSGRSSVAQRMAEAAVRNPSAATGSGVTGSFR